MGKVEEEALMQMITTRQYIKVTYVCTSWKGYSIHNHVCSVIIFQNGAMSIWCFTDGELLSAAITTHTVNCSH